MSERAARSIADSYSGQELLTMLGETADTPRRMPGSAPMDPLAEVTVHAQDITRPLGLTHRTDVDAVLASLEHVAGNRFYGTPTRLATLSAQL